jgi:hypothetical protein
VKQVVVEVAKIFFLLARVASNASRFLIPA